MLGGRDGESGMVALTLPYSKRRSSVVRRGLIGGPSAGAGCALESCWKSKVEFVVLIGLTRLGAISATAL